MGKDWRKSQSLVKIDMFSLTYTCLPFVYKSDFREPLWKKEETEWFFSHKTHTNRPKRYWQFQRSLWCSHTNTNTLDLLDQCLTHTAFTRKNAADSLRLYGNNIQRKNGPRCQITNDQVSFEKSLFSLSNIDIYLVTVIWGYPAVPFKGATHI